MASLDLIVLPLLSRLWLFHDVCLFELTLASVVKAPPGAQIEAGSFIHDLFLVQFVSLISFAAPFLDLEQLPD